MNYKEMRNAFEQITNEKHEDFTKALISFKKGINDKEALDKLYAEYMENDSMSLLWVWLYDWWASWKRSD